MPNQSTTIVDVVLVVLSLVALGLVVLAMLWRRWRARRAAAQLHASATAELQLPLSPEQEQAVRARIAELERQQAAPANGHTAPATSQAAEPALEAGDWIAALAGALHLLVIGHSRGGKTTLIHDLAQRRRQGGERVIVCDLDAAKGQWPGCEVHGYANDVKAVRGALGVVGAEWERRNSLRAAGVRSFDPLTLIVDEYADVAEEARELVERILRRGGKLDIHLVIGVQDKQVKTMGFEGQGDLRKNFAYVVEVRRDAAGRRWAALQENGEGPATTYAVPNLLDPESLIEPPTFDADRLLAQLFTDPQPQPQPPSHAPNGAAEASVSTPASAPAEPASAVAAWESEVAWVCPDNGRAATKGQVMELLRAARTEPAIVKELWQIDGTAGARYKAALDVVARIRAAALTGTLVEQA
jgi:hypothetical protein